MSDHRAFAETRKTEAWTSMTAEDRAAAFVMWRFGILPFEDEAAFHEAMAQLPVIRKTAIYQRALLGETFRDLGREIRNTRPAKTYLRFARWLTRTPPAPPTWEP